jgi:hypothetical protein
MIARRQMRRRRRRRDPRHPQRADHFHRWLAGTRNRAADRGRPWGPILFKPVRFDQLEREVLRTIS